MRKKLLFVIIGILILTACSNKNENKSNESNIKVVAEESNKKIKVGILQFVDHIALDRAREGFVNGLKDLGYEVEEELVNVQGDISLIPSAAKKLDADDIDIVYAIATPAAQGVKNIIKDKPIIFNAVTDPVEAELVESNEKPGGNVTGVSDYFPVKKQLENFLEIFPNVKRLGLLYSTGEANSQSQVKEVKQVCEELGIELVEYGVTSTNEVSQAMTSLVNKIDFYIGIQDNLASSSSSIISKILIDNNIPSLAGEMGPVESGILLSDGIDYEKLGNEAAKIANSIKEGKSPNDISVVFSENSSRVVNKNTARELGLSDNKKIFENAKEVE